MYEGKSIGNLLYFVAITSANHFQQLLDILFPERYFVLIDNQTRNTHNIIFFFNSGKCAMSYTSAVTNGFSDAILWAATTRSGHMVQDKDARICIWTL